MVDKINPVVLCGGVGTRLWPLSRSENPKQFQPISADSSVTFFQATVMRHTSELYNNPVISVSSRHVATVATEMQKIGVKSSIIAEPIAQNTGPAVLASALELVAKDPDAIMMVLPSDHVISGDFDHDIKKMLPAVAAGNIVIFGIEPEFPETGYGYIVEGESLSDGLFGSRVDRFVEKPERELAEELLAGKNAFWASGISLFKASVLISEYEKIENDTYNAVKLAHENGIRNETVLYLNGEHFSKARSAPTELAIFENTDYAALAPTSISWNDVGAWDAFYAIGNKDENGNVINGDVLTYDTKNSYVRSTKRLVTVMGVDDIIVVDTDDALLVTRKGKTQKIKSIVNDLTEKRRVESSRHIRQHSQWGQSNLLQSGDGFVVKALTIDVGRSIAIDAGMNTNKLITVAEGNGLVTIEGQVRHLVAGDTQTVTTSTKAIWENVGVSPLQLVEVSCDVANVDILAQQVSDKIVNISNSAAKKTGSTLSVQPKTGLRL
ncbi:MAG: mannose-1-phosphate guanylyltransferase/mannose-6-phosphate isomerase [Lentilitoribacter sp.]